MFSPTANELTLLARNSFVWLVFGSGMGVREILCNVLFLYMFVAVVIIDICRWSSAQNNRLQVADDRA